MQNTFEDTTETDKYIKALNAICTGIPEYLPFTGDCPPNDIYHASPEVLPDDLPGANVSYRELDKYFCALDGLSKLRLSVESGNPALRKYVGMCHLLFTQKSFVSKLPEAYKEIKDRAAEFVKLGIWSKTMFMMFEHTTDKIEELFGKRVSEFAEAYGDVKSKKGEGRTKEHGTRRNIVDYFIDVAQMDKVRAEAEGKTGAELVAVFTKYKGLGVMIKEVYPSYGSLVKDWNFPDDKRLENRYKQAKKGKL